MIWDRNGLTSLLLAERNSPHVRPLPQPDPRPNGQGKVLDVGVAAVVDADLPRLTVTGETLGTPPTWPRNKPSATPRSVRAPTCTRSAASCPNSSSAYRPTRPTRRSACCIRRRRSRTPVTMLLRASPGYGPGSPEILEARLDYAGILMLAGWYRTGLPVPEQLVVDPGDVAEVAQLRQHLHRIVSLGGHCTRCFLPSRARWRCPWGDGPSF